MTHDASSALQCARERVLMSADGGEVGGVSQL